MVNVSNPIRWLLRTMATNLKNRPDNYQGSILVSNNRPMLAHIHTISKSCGWDHTHD
jgi:hypothetical protein